MKKVITDFILILVAFVLIVLGVRFAWAYYVPTHCDNHINNPLVTTLVVGSSEAEACINDSILTNCLNLSESGLCFCANYNSIRWVNEYTDQKFDTVICTVGLSCFIYANKYNSDVREDPAYLHITERYSLIDYTSFLHDFALSKNGIRMLLEKVPYWDFMIKRMGGKYVYITRNKLHAKEASANLYRYQGIFGKDGFSEDVIRDVSAREVKYLRRIADYCRDNHKVFIIFNPPTYHITNFISDRGYKDYLLHEFGPDQLVADYDDFSFPDDSYYGDYEHLNHKGAEYLCGNIKKNGWRLTKLSDYCNK